MESATRWIQTGFILAPLCGGNHPPFRCSQLYLCFCSQMKQRLESQWSCNIWARFFFFFPTNNCHIAWAVSYSQRTAKITILAHSKQQGWLIKRRWWSGKYQSDNISEFGVSGCTVHSVAVCFQWLPCTCVSLKAQFVHKCSLQCVCTCLCVCEWRVSVFLLHPVARCVWVCVGSLWACWLRMLVGGLWSVFSGLHDLACENPLTPKTNT